jgi:hypothetical protein
MLPKSISSDNRRRTATITSSADAFCAENRNQSQDQENEKQKFRTPRYVERRKLLYSKGKTESSAPIPPLLPQNATKKKSQEKKRNSQLPATKPKTRAKKLLKNSSETAVSHAPDHRGNKCF